MAGDDPPLRSMKRPSVGASRDRPLFFDSNGLLEGSTARSGYWPCAELVVGTELFAQRIPARAEKVS